MKKTVLYIGNFSFPLGNAAGKRVYANGKLFRQLGYEVIYVGMSKEVDRQESLLSTKKEYDKFTCYNLPYPHQKLEWINYRQQFNILSKFLADENIVDDISLIIYYGSPRLSLFNTELIKYCNSRNIKVISDCVDWLTTKTNSFVFDLIKWADNTYQKVYANRKVDGVITISKYLSNYYEKHGCKTVIIPPLSPIKYISLDGELISNTKKIISYAGLPFRNGQPVTDYDTLKDRIDKTVKLLYRAKQNGCEFTFNIYGFTKKDYLQAIPEQELFVNELGQSIVFHGFKSNEEVVANIRKSDFTILIRDVNRDTTAGFPTKISESISCGTPVITTRTSDLELYISEGKDGYFLDIDNEENALSTLTKVLSMTSEEIMMMKKNCIESKAFYYDNYIYQMKKFLNDL